MKAITLALAMATALALPAGAQTHDHNVRQPGGDHSMVAYSNPADGAVLDESPRALTLAFQHPAALQSLSIADAFGRLTPAPFQAEPYRRTYTVSLPILPPGSYRIVFTAAEPDGADPMHGEIGFTVR